MLNKYFTLKLYKEVDKLCVAKMVEYTMIVLIHVLTSN